MTDKAVQAWLGPPCRSVGHLFDLLGIIPFIQLKEDYGVPETERL